MLFIPDFLSDKRSSRLVGASAKYPSVLYVLTHTCDKLLICDAENGGRQRMKNEWLHMHGNCLICKVRGEKKRLTTS